MKNQSQKLNINPFNYILTEIESVVNTTDSQLEIWTDCLIGDSDANKAYNLSYSIKFRGNLVLEALEYALKTIVQRHECLRASFSSDGLYMNVYKDSKIQISHNNISKLTNDEKEKSIESIIDGEVNCVFDLVKEPLFKVKLIKVDDLENIIVLTHHHIIGDGLSINIIVEELGMLYTSFIENIDPNLQNPERFSDYAQKVNSLIESSDYKKIEEYWLTTYKESVPVIELPINFSRPDLRTYNSQRFDFPIEDNLVNSLKELANSTGSSLTTALLSAFEVFLCKITGQNDLVVGLPVSGNWRYDMKHLIGNCANLLPLRTKVNSKISFFSGS